MVALQVRRSDGAGEPQQYSILAADELSSRRAVDEDISALDGAQQVLQVIGVFDASAVVVGEPGEQKLTV